MLRPRPALPFTPVGVVGGPLRVAALPEGCVLQVLASSKHAATGHPDWLAALGEELQGAIRGFAPGQWFVVADMPLGSKDLKRMADQVSAHAALCDQSHGRVRVSLEGPSARRLLAKGTGVDLGDAAFPIGRSAQTLFGHIGLHITRTAAEGFELLVLRSFADDLWTELTHAGAEFFSAPLGTCQG